MDSMSPVWGNPGTAFILYGHGFGLYNGTNTKVKVGGIAASLSLWSDTQIRGIIPDSLAAGTATVVVERTANSVTVQSNTLEFYVGGMAPGALPTASIARPEWHYEAELALAAEEGGKVETPTRASVEVPGHALDQDVVISIKKGASSRSQVQALDKAKLASAGAAMEFGPEGTRFSSPALIELPYDAAGMGLAERAVKVHYWDPGLKDWVAVASEVDLVHKRVRARTDHFSLYQPMVLADLLVQAEESFGLKELYAFPNPAKRTNPCIRLQTGLADSAKVEIYDSAGALVHKASFGPPRVLDDGNGKGPQWTFDYVWDVSGKGSGVYLYAVTASKAGYRDIKTTKKLAVLK
jgi:hypothetical protein